MQPGMAWHMYSAEGVVMMWHAPVERTEGMKDTVRRVLRL